MTKRLERRYTAQLPIGYKTILVRLPADIKEALVREAADAKVSLNLHCIGKLRAGLEQYLSTEEKPNVGG